MRPAFMQKSETQKEMGTGKCKKKISGVTLFYTTISIRKKEVRCSSSSERRDKEGGDDMADKIIIFGKQG